ncbi:MAG: hypothetical protein KME21_02295 [Desmonostoc vinosum HA7617-LM4]|jgi:hypothetical protein|nr:hypothetical protein [Desmonostoc vinosum HA7617-LM4]
MTITFSDISDSSELAKLQTEIISKRDIGKIVFEIKQLISDSTVEKLENVTNILNLFVTQLGYFDIDNKWLKINQEEAKKISLLVMTKDLAYRGEIMDIEAAEQISTQIFNLFAKDCQFFTNAIFVDNYSAISSWNPVTPATFDTGIIILSNTKIGMLWVEDED